MTMVWQRATQALIPVLVCISVTGCALFQDRPLPPTPVIRATPEITIIPSPTPIPPPTPEPTIANGISVFQKMGCQGCHTLEAANAAGVVGPTLEGIAATAALRLADPAYTGTATTAGQYLRESMVDPGVYTVPDYPEGVMPSYASIEEGDIEAMVMLLLAQE